MRGRSIRSYECATDAHGELHIAYSNLYLTDLTPVIISIYLVAGDLQRGVWQDCQPCESHLDLWWVLWGRGCLAWDQGEHCGSWLRYWRVSLTTLVVVALIRFNSSIRIPAAMNGIYGFRPSYHRIPFEGSVNSLEGQDSLPSVLGPLSTDLGGIKLFMQAVINQRPWLKDPRSVRKHWDEDEYRLTEHGGGERLTFGILWNDGLVVPQPPIIRALNMTREALLAAGHDGKCGFRHLTELY